MTKVQTSYQNFSRGVADVELSGRYDLPIYYSSTPVFYNFETNFKGNALFRTGFEQILKFQDCKLVLFKGSSTTNYVLVLYNTKMRFISYDSNGSIGWVLSGGLPLEVTTPYSLAESKQVKWVQRGNVMELVHPSYRPRQLVRTGAAAFTLSVSLLQGDPFVQIVANVSAVTKAFPCSVTTTAAHGLVTGDSVAFASVVGMTELNGNTYRITVESATKFWLTGIDSTAYTAYASGGTATRAEDCPSCVTFYKGRKYYAGTTTRPTWVFASQAGDDTQYTIPLSGLKDSDPAIFELSDISRKINWLHGGSNSLIAGSYDGVVVINGGSTSAAITASNAQATLTMAEPPNDVQPLNKGSFIYYVSRDGRSVHYFRYNILSEAFESEDANIISRSCTVSGITRLERFKGIDDLIFMNKSNGDWLSLNAKVSEQETILGWHNGFQVSAGVGDFCVVDNQDIEPELLAVVNRGGTYYIERRVNRIDFKNRDQFYSGDADDDDEAWYRDCAEKVRNLNYLDNAQTVFYLKDNSITYDSGAGTITATSAVFSSGDVGKHIDIMTQTGYESGRFLITGYTSSTVVSVSILSTPTDDTFQYWYLTFSTVSGLSDYNGVNLSVVADGAYIGEFLVSGGEVSLDRQCSQIWIGYKYVGIIKTFPLGFQSQGLNTQTTYKIIHKVGIRFSVSMGGYVGTSQYDVKPIAQWNTGVVNYLPNKPMTGTKYTLIQDGLEKDKALVILQSEPVPCNITAVMVDCNYGNMP